MNGFGGMRSDDQEVTGVGFFLLILCLRGKQSSMSTYLADYVCISYQTWMTVVEQGNDLSSLADAGRSYAEPLSRQVTSGFALVSVPPSHITVFLYACA